MNSNLSAEIRRVLRGRSETATQLTWTVPGAGGRLARTLAAGALLGLLMPFPAEALQLGPITAHSALSEPLDARVALVTRDATELDQLKVGLAAKEHFDRAGIPRDHALGRLRFRMAEDSDGNPIIRVSTHAAFREPVLTFLLEVVNARTHMVREYSILLDPPVYTAPVRTAAAPAGARQTAPAARTPERTQAPRETAPARRAPPASTRPATAAAPAQPAGVPGTARADDDARARREALAGLARDMARLRERIEARREEGEAISQRLSRVEKNISGLREVIARQQQAMEALQERIAAMPPVAQVASAPAAHGADAGPAVAGESSAEAAPTSAPAAVPVLGESAPAPSATEAAPAVASLQAQIQSGLANYALEALLGLAAVGLLGWALALRARLSRLQESDGEDALAEAEPAPPAQPVAEARVAPVDAGMPSVFEPVGEADLEEDGESSDAIPFSEAAIYHAYGDYDQAESLLEDLVDKHPESEQYRLALLRVLHEARRPDAFQKHALALQAMVTDPGTNEAWQETVEMSQELKVALAAAEPASAAQGFVKTVVLADRPVVAGPDTADAPEAPLPADADPAPAPGLDTDDWSVSLEDVPAVDPDDTLVPVATMELGAARADALVDVEPDEAERELAAAGLPEPEGDDEETDVLDWADNLLERHAHQDEESVEIEDDELAQSLVLELELEPMESAPTEEGDLDLTATSKLKASSG